VGLMKRMATIAAECMRTPGRDSIWSERLGRYVCDKDPEFHDVVADQSRVAVPAVAALPPVKSPFKLVFWTATGGTILFLVICVGTTALVGKEPHPMTERMVTSLFDMAKIGFGAIVGLLGGLAQKG